MAKDKERSNRDPDDHKRQGANSANENQSRKPAHSRAARSVANKSGDQHIPVKDPNHRKG
jgi:hypothetical protein